MEQSSILILHVSCRQTCITCASAECTVANSWWWVEELPEICRALYKNRFGNECVCLFHWKVTFVVLQRPKNTVSARRSSPSKARGTLHVTSYRSCKGYGVAQERGTSTFCEYTESKSFVVWIKHSKVSIEKYKNFCQDKMCIYIIFIMNQKCTINWQIIILLLHVSTLLCRPQRARSHYLLSYISMPMQPWWYNLNVHICFLLLNLNV